jgi:hypothetical protein
MAKRNLGDEMAIMHMAALAELGIIPPVCPWCDGTGTENGEACGWCDGTGNAPQATSNETGGRNG